jgi:TonB family protein
MHSMYLSTRFFFAIMLAAALVALQAQGTESKGSLIVYNRIGKPSDTVDDVAARKKFGTKYQIVEVEKNSSLTTPKCVECEIPKRPRDSSGRVAAGTLRVVFILTADGRVTEPFVVQSSNPVLDTSVLDQIRSWRLTPARLNGLPVAALISQEFLFDKPKPQEGTFGFKYAKAIDAKGIEHTPREDPDGLARWMEDLTKRVQPDSAHNDDRQHQGEGSGVFRVTIDLKTGIVTDVAVVKSTEHYALDNNARVALRQWRWKPGKWKQIDIPITFGSPQVLPTSGHEFPAPVQSVPRGVTP